jgi:hypothetical protein
MRKQLLMAQDVSQTLDSWTQPFPLHTQIVLLHMWMPEPF